MTVAILVPVLNRPHRAAPLVASTTAATPEPHRVVFICDPDDHPQQDAVRATGADMLIHGGSYARKIRAGIAATTEPLVFLAADDLEFRPGWLPAAVAHLTERVQVVGVNDLLERRPGREGHATHFLLTRAYAEQPCIDGTPGPLHEGYSHSFVDDELIGTATRRGAYAYAESAHVAHLHPMAGTAADDDTYRKGRARFRHDRRLFLRRRSLWT